MPSRPIHQVLAGRPFVDVSIFTSVREVTQRMQAQHCSAALITEHGVLTGIFTERDLMRRVVAVHRNAATTPLSDVMTTALVTCTPEATASDCGALMSEKNIRHLPVVEEGRVVGMVSIRDIVTDIIADQDFTISQLEHYISGQ